MLDKVESVLMLRKSKAERKMKFFDTPSEKTSLRKTDTHEGLRQAAKWQTCKDVVPWFKRLEKAGHGGCIATGE